MHDAKGYSGSLTGSFNRGATVDALNSRRSVVVTCPRLRIQPLRESGLVLVPLLDELGRRALT
jgi:hypothetical protein